MIFKIKFTNILPSMVINILVKCFQGTCVYPQRTKRPIPPDLNLRYISHIVALRSSSRPIMSIPRSLTFLLFLERSVGKVK